MKGINKNKSRTVPNGTILQTRDEFFENSKGYKKQGYKENNYYRKAIVVDSNRKDELAVIKGTTKGQEIPGLKKTTIKPFIETKDHKNNPIKVGKFFKIPKKKKRINKAQVNYLKKLALKKSSKKLQKQNRSKLRILKGRR